MSQGQSADNCSVIKTAFMHVLDARIYFLIVMVHFSKHGYRLQKKNFGRQCKKCRSAVDVDMQICSFYPINQAGDSTGAMERLLKCKKKIII